MRQIYVAGLVLALAATTVQAASSAEGEVRTSLKIRAEAVITAHRNDRGREASTATIAQAFDRIRPEELKPDALADYDLRTLELLFESVAIASERLEARESLAAMDAIFQECLGRGFIGNMVDRMYAGYVRQRAWEKARSLDNRFPSRPRKVPRIVQPSAVPAGVPSFYEVSEDGESLTLRAADLTGPMIVSAVSPGCRFSQAIVELIEADPWLTALFREHSINVHPSPFRVDAPGLARANADGRFSYVVLHLPSDWTGFDFSSVPQFYFVKDGQVVYQIRSTTPEEFREQMTKGLELIELRFAAVPN